MTPERAKSATPALPRSNQKPFLEKPHHQPKTTPPQKKKASNTNLTLP